jgi:uncharacterized protein (TIGR02246 family)
MNKQSHQLLITGAAVAGVANAAYRAVVRRILRHGARALMAGDPEPLLRSFAEDAVLFLDGTHSWAGEHRGKAGIRAFFERFLQARVRGEVHEILVQGPPWRTTVMARFTDHAVDSGGTAIVYENRAVIVGTLVWGRIRAQRIYEDTQRVAEFDRILERRGDPVALTAVNPPA